MLNISPNSIKDQVDQDRYSAMDRVEKRRSGKVRIRPFSGLDLITLMIMFLPWTQNIRTGGNKWSRESDSESPGRPFRSRC